MNYNHYVIARALHVIAVVIWIGGVAFVTTVLIPAIRKSHTPDEMLNTFEKLEKKFSFQAKFTTLLTGATGFYMVHVMNAWASMQWWMYLMIFVWAIFTIILFVLEPLILHQWFHQKAKTNPNTAFLLLHLMHIILLSISVIAIFGGVAGAHGFIF